MDNNNIIINNNNYDNIYGAVIVAQSHCESTGFIWWIWHGAKRPPTLRTDQTTRAVSLTVGFQKPRPPSPFITRLNIITEKKHLLKYSSQKAELHTEQNVTFKR